MKIPLIDLRAQYNTIKSEIDKTIQRIIENSSFIMGEEVRSFERSFAEYCNAKFCVGTSSGTTALQIALLASGITSGEVITATHTFAATAEAIHNVGAKAKFIDIKERNFNMDTDLLKKALTNETRAIIPVHLYGQTVDMDPIIQFAKEHNLIVIDDCAQAHGAEYKGRRVPIGDVGCFSFFPGKNLGAFGDAGGIVTNNEEIAEKAAMLVDHGRKKGEKYTHSAIGQNFRLDALQAAILASKLKYLEKWTESKRVTAKFYNSELEGVVITPFEEPYTKHVYYVYTIRIQKRDDLKKYLESKGIATGIYYPIPLHLQEAFKELNHKENDFPVAEKVSKEILSIPIYPELSQEQKNYICNSIKEFFG